ncbi:hypothetical protein L1987_84968 [Smallanthus sonchifolius]|uniref:Uncharacterized protein n=1 Tax=Smallanthus sonchifolius TaxID=185202 RepID=A0ACB8XVV0_9ASTR|nr:hypothetical protein L1987_84968 [Smallanthus sonchifolius]
MASMASSLCIFFFFFFTLLCFSNAYTFNVGGKDGWTLHPSESYSQWSSRLRFIVKDNLHFKYDSGSDSVMEVSRGDYDSCNTNSPITTLTGGDSVFNLNRPGPFFFISGNKSNCDQGQKLTVVVISPKTKHTPPAAAPTPAKSTSPVSPVSSPPESGTPGSTSPVGSPSGGISSPPTGNPADSPGGGASSPTGGPAASPGGGGSSSPTGGPAASPDGGGSSSPTDGPAASPGGGVSSSPSGGPAGSPGGGPSGSPTGNPADVNNPAPNGSQTRPAVSATLRVLLAMIVFVVGLVY